MVVVTSSSLKKFSAGVIYNIFDTNLVCSASLTTLMHRNMQENLLQISNKKHNGSTGILLQINKTPIDR